MDINVTGPQFKVIVHINIRGLPALPTEWKPASPARKLSVGKNVTEPQMKVIVRINIRVAAGRVEAGTAGADNND